MAGLYASGLEIAQLEAAVLYLARHGREYMDPDYGAALELAPQLLAGGVTDNLQDARLYGGGLQKNVFIHREV